MCIRDRLNTDYEGAKETEVNGQILHLNGERDRCV